MGKAGKRHEMVKGNCVWKTCVWDRVRELLVCLYVYVFRCHACHADCTSMSPSATAATQSEGRRRQVPRLPHKVKVDAAKCHAVTQSGAASPGNQARHQSQPTASATPATQIARRCHQVPPLPRKVKVCVWESCVWRSCVYVSCVWLSCVCELCVSKLCVCVRRTSCVWVRCVCV